ncbi:MAG: hypothetical protein WCD79_18015 [Chthoniobacteraceae bacterium]
MVTEEIIAEMLAAEGLREADLPNLRKGAPGKVRIARRLREETTLTLRQIAERLKMGVGTHVAHLLYHKKDELL